MYVIMFVAILSSLLKVRSLRTTLNLLILWIFDSLLIFVVFRYGCLIFYSCNLVDHDYIVV